MARLHNSYVTIDGRRLHRGRWGEDQILSERYVDIAASPCPLNPWFGYLWWLDKPRTRYRRVAAKRTSPYDAVEGRRGVDANADAGSRARVIEWPADGRPMRRRWARGRRAARPLSVAAAVGLVVVGAGRHSPLLD